MVYLILFRVHAIDRQLRFYKSGLDFVLNVNKLFKSNYLWPDLSLAAVVNDSTNGF